MRIESTECASRILLLSTTLLSPPLCSLMGHTSYFSFTSHKHLLCAGHWKEQELRWLGRHSTGLKRHYYIHLELSSILHSLILVEAFQRIMEIKKRPLVCRWRKPKNKRHTSIKGSKRTGIFYKGNSRCTKGPTLVGLEGVQPDRGRKFREVNSWRAATVS